jgi:hypothetical protein
MQKNHAPKRVASPNAPSHTDSGLAHRKNFGQSIRAAVPSTEALLVNAFPRDSRQRQFMLRGSRGPNDATEARR